MNAAELKARLHRTRPAITPPEKLELGAGYRGARRNVSVLCAIGIAWAAAQFDLKVLTVGPAQVDLTAASIPTILVCAILYAMTRASIEYAMQALEVRRWGFAILDLKVTMWLVRLTVLFLGWSAVSRSLLAVLIVLAGAILLGVLSFAAMIALGFLISGIASIFPGLIPGFPPKSVASIVISSFLWAELLAFVVPLLALIWLGWAALNYPPVQALRPAAASAFAVWFAVGASIAVVLSVLFNLVWLRAVTAELPPYTEAITPDGTLTQRYFGRYKPRWGWGYNEDQARPRLRWPPKLPHPWPGQTPPP